MRTVFFQTNTREVSHGIPLLEGDVGDRAIVFGSLCKVLLPDD